MERVKSMSEYHIGQIFSWDRRTLRDMDGLLEKEGIERDRNLDYSAGLFDDSGRLVATGSCFKNTLRCMAVDSAHQGEGLMNEIVSHLIDVQYRRGNMELFLYTKCSTAKFFSDLGFYEIARVQDRVVFMENRRDGFSGYLERLKRETAAFSGTPGPEAGDGAVILNANPFTLGHQYLVETAAAHCRLLHVFVVSEDASLVPFAVRKKLVMEGCSHLSNLVFHETGSYMISSATFPSYFLKDAETVIRSHAMLDIEIFLKIAGALSISRRFVGEEPFSQVTGIYNQVMQAELANRGLSCLVIPRKENAEGVISASRVRQMIHDGQLERLRDAVPPSTYRFFTSEEARPVIEAIRASEEVVHY